MLHLPGPTEPRPRFKLARLLRSVVSSGWRPEGEKTDRRADFIKLWQTFLDSIYRQQIARVEG